MTYTNEYQQTLKHLRDRVEATKCELLQEIEDLPTHLLDKAASYPADLPADQRRRFLQESLVASTTRSVM